MENILLNPAYDVYLMVGTSIRYKVQKIDLSFRGSSEKTDISGETTNKGKGHALVAFSHIFVFVFYLYEFEK